MAANLPGPYELEYEYLQSGLVHKLRLNCVAIGNPPPGTPAVDVQLQQKGGATDDVEALALLFWGYLRPFFNASTSVAAVNLWKYVPGTYQKIFITSCVSSFPVGTNVSASDPAREWVLSFRSANGGIMYIRLEEGGTNTGTYGRTSLAAAGPATVQGVIRDFVLSSASFLVARDDSFPIAGYRLLIGQNEAIFKKRFRVS